MANEMEKAEARPLLDQIYPSGHYEDHVPSKVPQGPWLQQKPGKWKATVIISGYEYLETTAFYGILMNLMVYLRTVFHESSASAAANVTSWNGLSNFMSLVGALISDGYWGNYKTVCISSLIYLLGMMIITISSLAPSLKPPPCDGSFCEPANSIQNLVFFSGLYLVAFGCGGVKSALLTLGADQFDESDNNAPFFNLMYLATILGTLTSSTLIVWVQENVNWSLGFGIATSCLVLGFGAFILGTPNYRSRKASSSPLKSILQVLVASFKKLSLEVPDDSRLLFEAEDGNPNMLEQRRLAHTTEFRFLDKAAFVLDSDRKDGVPRTSWSLCTVTQVEEVKVLIHFLPICATSAVLSIALSQMATTFVEQGRAMNTRIGSFSVPPASFSSVNSIGFVLWLLIYDKMVVPTSRRLFGREPTHLQRMAMGHFVLILAMSAAALVEAKRLARGKVGISMSITYQLFQYTLLSATQVLYFVGFSRFFYEEAPDTMKTVCTGLGMLVVSVGSYLSSLTFTLVHALTTAGGGAGWLPDDLNEGHLDYFFWSLAGLFTVNFVAYLAFTWNYTYKKYVPVAESCH